MPIKSALPDYAKTDGWEYARASILVGQETARINFLDKLEGDGVPESVKVNLEDMPNVPILPKAGTLIGEVQILFDPKKKKVIAINPYSGRFTAKATELGPKDQDKTTPVFKVKPNAYDNGNDDVTFWCQYIITADPDNGGLFVGCNPRYHLKYKFFNLDGFVNVEGDPSNPKATRVRQLLEWGAAHGIFDVDMAWPSNGNVLPGLQYRLQNENTQEVTIELDRGYITKARAVRGSLISVVEETPAETAPAMEDPDFGG